MPSFDVRVSVGKAIFELYPEEGTSIVPAYLRAMRERLRFHFSISACSYYLKAKCKKLTALLCPAAS